MHVNITAATTTNHIMSSQHNVTSTQQHMYVIFIQKAMFYFKIETFVLLMYIYYDNLENQYTWDLSKV